MTAVHCIEPDVFDFSCSLFRVVHMIRCSYNRAPTVLAFQSIILWILSSFDIIIYRRISVLIIVLCYSVALNQIEYNRNEIDKTLYFDCKQSYRGIMVLIIQVCKRAIVLHNLASFVNNLALKDKCGFVI